MYFFYKLLYNCGVWLYTASIYLSQPFNDKARQWVKGRQNLFTALTDSLKDAEREKKRSIWIHCASLGEFEQARPVIDALNKNNKYFIILSFFSPSGYEQQHHFKGADIITYLPTDTPFNAQKFINLIQPDTALFVKYEFWYHHLNMLHQNNIPCYLISAIFQPNQIFFRWYGELYRQMLRFMTKIFVQDESSAELLKGLGIKHVEISGDTRVERVHQINKSPQKLKLLPEFKGEHQLFIAGSTYRQEEQLLVQLMREQKLTKVKYVIAPHEVDDSTIEKITNTFRSWSPVRFSEAVSANIQESQVLIIDSIGLLASLYQYGELCFIGGGFGGGIHNILEPAAVGLPIIIGPNYKKFKEARELVSAGGAFSVKNYKEFKTIVTQLTDKEAAMTQKARKVTRQYIKKNIGATEKIIEAIENN
jgi:3-deoxy-D-manno-octulosonic-acid transferase